MPVDPKEDLVQRAYLALDADDVPALLALFSADATVEYPAPGDLPYGGAWEGHEGIGRFLDLHDATEEILEFEPNGMAVAGDDVYVRGHFRGRSRATGRTWETRWVHVFNVVGDRIRRWDGYFDTAAAVAAHQP